MRQPLITHGELRQLQLRVENRLQIDFEVEALFEPPGTLVIVMRKKSGDLIVPPSNVVLVKQ